jgi:filamentous hemagglutinin
VPEFPEYQNALEYTKGAKDFVDNPPQGTLTKVRANGDKLFYEPKSNTFAVKNSLGEPKTMFRPTDRMAYWLKQ